MRGIAIVIILLGVVIFCAAMMDASGKPPMEFRIGIGNALTAGLWVCQGLLLWALADIGQAIVNRRNQSGKEQP
jgi:hypothetical protein